MGKEYISPKLNLSAFNCPYCGAYSQMFWCGLKPHTNYSVSLNLKLSMARCSHCGESSIWNGDIMVIPSCSTVEMPNKAMPREVKDLYEEAREIVNKSPRGSAALLRLALDKLCDFVDEECKKKTNIDKKIAILVKNGLSADLQKIFDFVRITGNDAVHELGIIDVQDNPDIAITLFKLVNLIVEKMIEEKAEIMALYDLIPEDKKKNINERNEKIKGKLGAK